MGLKSHFEMMAKYNHWFNGKIYDSASSLSEEILNKDQGAFFKSISGTLNHIFVADTNWLKRFVTQPKNYAALSYVVQLPSPKSLDDIMYEKFSALSKERRKLDEVIINWCAECEEQDYSASIIYPNMKGIEYRENYGSLVQHFFNHQTHHRGQVSTLLFQNGIDVGVTDLLAIIRGL